MRHGLLLMMVLAVLNGFAQDDRTRVEISTDSGNIIIELYNETPLHRDNFIKLVNEGFYDSTSFHRVIESFMIQGGDPNSKPGSEGVIGNGGPGYKVPAEINPLFYHKKGALSAARQGDNVNPQRESSGSQFYLVQGKPFGDEDLDQFEQRINFDIRNQLTQAFFKSEENVEYLNRLKVCQQERNQEEMQAIMDEVNPIIDSRFEEKKYTYSEEQREVYRTVGGTPHLDMQYTVFGEVVEGLDVIDKIASVEKNRERPVVPHRMTLKVLD